MKLDADFVSDLNCIGRDMMPRGQRLFADIVCRLIGHNLWRVLNSTRRLENHSLDHYATYCRRCYRGGYVQGDYR